MKKRMMVAVALIGALTGFADSAEMKLMSFNVAWRRIAAVSSTDTSTAPRWNDEVYRDFHFDMVMPNCRLKQVFRAVSEE